MMVMMMFLLPKCFTTVAYYGVVYSGVFKFYVTVLLSTLFHAKGHTYSNMCLLALYVLLVLAFYCFITVFLRGNN